MEDYLAGLRTSIRGNAAAYAYSVTITATFGALSLEEAPASGGRIFLFALGAAAAFTIVEAAGSNLFRDRSRGEPSEVVVLGSAMGVLSIASSLGAAFVVVALLDGWLSWLLAPAGTTAVYLVASALEMGLARKAEARR